MTFNEACLAALGMWNRLKDIDLIPVPVAGEMKVYLR